jgi:hypothetical protein
MEKIDQKKTQSLCNTEANCDLFFLFVFFAFLSLVLGILVLGSLISRLFENPIAYLYITKHH